MNPREAEKLLGGYATGTLDEAERKALFAAALEDQALFDALADEEALRELLADPASRAQLLAALAPPKVRPFWRRPGAMALAASLIAAVGVGLLLKETKTPEMRRLPQAPTPLEQAPASAPTQTLAAPAKPTPKIDSRERRAAPQQAPPPPPPPPPAEALAAGAPPPAQADRATESKAAPAPANQPPAPAPQDKANLFSAAGGVAAKRAASSDTSSPAWSFEGRGAARQLVVDWGPDGVLTLVAREPGDDRAIAPLRASTLPDGRRQSRFAAPEDAPPLDLFWSAQRLPAYPAEGPVEGTRIRVWAGKPE